MPIQNNTNPIFGGFSVRLFAYLIDIISINIVLMVIRIPMWITSLFSPNNPLNKDILFTFSTKDILLYVLSVIYFILMTYFTGATLGKRLLHLQVISTSGEKLSLLNVIYRETIGRYLSSLMCLGYILIAVDQEKRGFHDILCDTRVIYTNTVVLIEDSGIVEDTIV